MGDRWKELTGGRRKRPGGHWSRDREKLDKTWALARFGIPSYGAIWYGMHHAGRLQIPARRP